MTATLIILNTEHDMAHLNIVYQLHVNTNIFTKLEHTQAADRQNEVIDNFQLKLDAIFKMKTEFFIKGWFKKITATFILIFY